MNADQVLSMAGRWLQRADLPACVLVQQTAADLVMLPPAKMVLVACALDVLRLASKSQQGRQALADMGLPGLFGSDAGAEDESASLADEVAALRRLMERMVCSGNAMRVEVIGNAGPELERAPANDSDRWSE